VGALGVGKNVAMAGVPWRKEKSETSSAESGMDGQLRIRQVGKRHCLRRKSSSVFGTGTFMALGVFNCFAEKLEKKWSS
jgi:hypothetical protein